MKNLKNQKGITLVALVVTIIVLLILAGVSLSLIAGENGILGRATGAVDKNAQATSKEQAELLIADYAAGFYEEKYVDGTYTTGTQLDYIDAQLKKTEGTTNKTNDGVHTVAIDMTKTPAEITVTDTKNSKGNITGTISDTGAITWPTTKGTEGTENQ